MNNMVKNPITGDITSITDVIPITNNRTPMKDAFKAKLSTLSIGLCLLFFTGGMYTQAFGQESRKKTTTVTEVRIVSLLNQEKLHFQLEFANNKITSL
jgi:hypothetical protein